ncbi:MAG: TetR-like C-terminal domain-containing protein [Acidimicrobiales bacterium]
MDFALQNPARYQAMFGAVGECHPERGADELPGFAVFEGLRQRMLEATGRRRGAGPDPFQATICLWAALHGLASLRISKPSFPWPPLGSLVTQTLGAHLRSSARRR